MHLTSYGMPIPHACFLLADETTRYGVEQLSKEPELMQAECKRAKQQLEELAFKNYKALIAANDCIHDIRVEVRFAFHLRFCFVFSFFLSI